jgi:hypothetical protein
VIKSAKQTVKVELVADGLMTPWAIAFLPDGRMLVTERDGRPQIMDKGKLTLITGTPKRTCNRTAAIWMWKCILVTPATAGLSRLFRRSAGYVAPPPPPADPAAAPAAPPAPGGAQGRGGRGGVRLCRR